MQFVHVFTTIFVILLVVRLVFHLKALVAHNMEERDVEKTVRHVLCLFLLSSPPFWGIYWINVLANESCFTEAGSAILTAFLAAISMVFAIFVNDYKIRWY